MAFLDPALAISGAEGLIGNTIFMSLVRFKSGSAWGWRLDAAEHFEQLDGTHYAFRLKPGQYFNNDLGEITADDVKYSLERIIRPDKNYAVQVWAALDMGSVRKDEVKVVQIACDPG